ncbi:MAG: hypothetical protein Q8Q14_08245 [Gemmatimonadales bacterium]|nr:hypothetical protein [Gemmatimonadales bacterium]
MKLRWLTLTVSFYLFAGSQAAEAQTSPCLANPDTAAIHVAFVTRQVTVGDSARLAQQGLPYQPPAGVALVSDTTICRAVIDAYNGLDSVPATNVARAYVMTVGTTAYAMVGDTSGVVYIVFDTAYNVLGGIVPMQ